MKLPYQWLVACWKFTYSSMMFPSKNLVDRGFPRFSMVDYGQYFHAGWWWRQHFPHFFKGVLRPALSWPGAGRHQDPKPSAWESSEADLVMSGDVGRCAETTRACQANIESRPGRPPGWPSWFITSVYDNPHYRPLFYSYKLVYIFLIQL